MKENVGSVDKVLRGFLGSAAVAAGVTLLRRIKNRTLGAAALVGGALLLDSAITRTCPTNYVLGIDSRED